MQVSFQDVGGCHAAKEELYDYCVEFLNNYKALGAPVFTGILIVGPAGTGRSLLARAVAGEASVPFFSLNAVDDVDGQIKEVFTRARASAPSIIFIPDLHRLKWLPGGECPRALHQLLKELDGMATATAGVVVIARAEKEEDVDETLLRPGRLDGKVFVSKPTIDDLGEIFQAHIRKMGEHAEHDLPQCSREMAGLCSGNELMAAEVVDICTEARVSAQRSTNGKGQRQLGGRLVVKKEHLEAGLQKVVVGAMFGPKKTPQHDAQEEKDDDELVVTAHHEAGHAVVSWLLKNAWPSHLVSIEPYGAAVGFNLLMVGEEKKKVKMAAICENGACISMAGRAAEQHLCRQDSGELTVGDHTDLYKATEYAYCEGRGDMEAKTWLDGVYKKAQELVARHWHLVVRVAELLLEKKVLKREDLEQALVECRFEDEEEEITDGGQVTNA